MPVLDFATRSIARRLFFTAAALSFLLLLVASLLLTQYYRRNAEDVFERRLEVYLRAIVAHVSQPGEEGRGPGQLGEPQFELPNSGWYWQITRTDDEEHEILASRSLFASQLPKLADFGVIPETGGARRGTTPGPDGRLLRIVERVIDVGDTGVYLVQVAGNAEEVEHDIDRFRFALT
ncbi:MAG TPA: sensor histidine kinase, partial [Methylocystis sp.]